jgi:hypothetical protein
MKNRTFNLLLTVPILIIGTGQTVASHAGRMPPDWNRAIATEGSTEQFTDTRSPSFLISARGEDSEACRLLGLCK